jgi:hypothetical protein
MNGTELFSWLSLLFLFGLMAGWYVTQGRHLVQQYSSRKWPSIEAVIQRGAIGPVNMGKGAVNGCFLGYSFQAAETRYAGFFVIFCDHDKSAQLQKELPGATLQVRYKRSDPNVSYLADRQDPRFGWQGASQNPEYLNQAPPFDLKDAVRSNPRLY